MDDVALKCRDDGSFAGSDGISLPVCFCTLGIRIARRAQPKSHRAANFFFTLCVSPLNRKFNGEFTRLNSIFR